MHKLMFILVFLISSRITAQELNLLRSLKEISKQKEFRQVDLEAFHQKYSALLEIHAVQIPSDRWKNDTVGGDNASGARRAYKRAINRLLYSDNPNKRAVAYIITGFTFDKTHEPLLAKRMDSETSAAQFYLAFALLYLKSNHTTKLFDYFTINSPDLFSAALPFFSNLSKDSLRQTATRRMFSNNMYARIGATHLLTITGSSPVTDELLLSAVDEWPWRMKGYAVSAIARLKLGDLKEHIIPLIDSASTNHIALAALAESPAKADSIFLNEFIKASDTISANLLYAYLFSTNVENVKKGLMLLTEKQIPTNFNVLTSKQPLLYSDKCLPAIQYILSSSDQASLLADLVNVLEGRNDSISEKIFIRLVKHEDSRVRESTSATLSRSSMSENLLRACVEGFFDEKKRSISLVHILISNKIDTLQPVFESIYSKPVDKLWQEAAVQYLGAFPLEKHATLFESILLKNSREHYGQNRYAALGLARLGRHDLIDLIIAASRSESQISDVNSKDYLVALAMLGGKKARAEIKTFLKSPDPEMQKFATALLAR